MEIEQSKGDVESQQMAQFVNVEEFSQLVESLPRKWNPRLLLGSIHRVPPYLRARQPNKRVYDPEIISLGPYHHGKPELVEAEGFKQLSLDWLTEGDEPQMQSLYNAILDNIHWIRDLYTDTSIDTEYDDKKLALMMLLDASFIINLMMNCTGMAVVDQPDWLDSRGMAASIQIMICDVFVLENQIPLRVIDLVMMNQYSMHAEELVESFLGWTLKKQDRITTENGNPPIHILEACWRAVVGTPSYSELDSPLGKRKTPHVSHTPCHSVMELKAKGIHFEPSPSNYVKDITFDSHALYGELKLPVQYVSPQTQVMLSNLIAFELSPCSGNGLTLVVLAYVIFMKSLIETAADVKELQRKGVLISCFPNHEQAVRVFREIDTFGYGDFDFFAEVKRGVEDHCTSRAKTWIADLIHTRFESPWSAIALLAALLLLILTFLQAWYTMHPAVR